MATTAILAALWMALPAFANAATIKGTAAGERIVGTNNADHIRAKRGADRVFGRGSSDFIRGGKGRDLLVGGNGGDRLKAGKGRDVLRGGKGKDSLLGGAGVDILRGGKGRDKLRADDGRADTLVNGGAGNDICKVDGVDVEVVRNCETVRVVNPVGPDDPRGGDGSGGGGSSGGGASGGGGGSSEDPNALQVTSSTTHCPPEEGPGNGCQFDLSGTGADTSNGAVEVKQGEQVTGGGPGSGDPETGEWSATGVYGCSDTVVATVEFGEESDSVFLPCASSGGSEPPEPPSPGEDTNGPLTITSTTSSCSEFQSFGFQCEFTASGTGADLQTGGARVTIMEVVAGGGTVTADNAGNWTVTDGQYGCPATPAVSSADLTVSVGSDQKSAPGSLTCTP